MVIRKRWVIIFIFSRANRIYLFLPILTSYSIGKVLKKLNFNSVKIKIPNDVYLNNKKVCGVISESYFKGDKTSW